MAADSVSEAAQMLENGIGGAGNKWRSGVQNPDQSPSEGLSDVQGFDMAGRGGEYDSYWSERANTQQAQDKFESSASSAAEKWTRNWSDASNWSIGGE